MPRADQRDAIVAFVTTVVVMTYVIREVRIDVTVAGTTTPTGIAAQWIVPIGVLVTLVVGGAASRFHPSPDTPGQRERELASRT